MRTMEASSATLDTQRQRLRRVADHLRVARHRWHQPATRSAAADEVYLLRVQYEERMRELALPVPSAPPYSVSEYHTEAAKARPDILDWQKVIEQWDHEEFLRDGVAVFKGIFTPDATHRLIASCENVQRHNDSWLDHDWHEPSQWRALGLQPPTVPPLTEEDKAKTRGGCQLTHSTLRRIFSSVEENSSDALGAGGCWIPSGVGRLRDSRSIRWPCGTGYIPEHCPMGYDEFISNCITHPQMIRLHQLMLGPEVRFDHNTLLSRRDFEGQHWHSHAYHEDEAGVTTIPGGARLKLVRSLVYPEGFKKYNDGGLKIVRGAHLYRSVGLDPYRRAAIRPGTKPGFDDDRVFEETWLSGKIHPLTGKPLRIEYLELPPGSMAVCLCHCPHGVSPRPPGSGTRHCTLFSYREPDPDGMLPVSTNEGLQPWELERDCALGKMEGVKGGAVNLFSLY